MYVSFLLALCGILFLSQGFSKLLTPAFKPKYSWQKAFLFFSLQKIVLCELRVGGRSKVEKSFHLLAKYTGPLGILIATSKSAEQIFFIKDGI